MAERSVTFITYNVRERINGSWYPPEESPCDGIVFPLWRRAGMDTRQLTVCREGERMQCAALPYRLSGGLLVLLQTSRDTGRWVLPKAGR
jgi:hypothetical protein